MIDWIELAAAACNHAGFRYKTLETLVTWNQEYCANAVYRLDNQHYLKLYGPTSHRQFHVERAVLQLLESQPEIPAPFVLTASEHFHDAPFLILSGMSGRPAEDVWDNIEPIKRIPIAKQLENIVSAIHTLPVEQLSSIESGFGDRARHVFAPQLRRRIAEIRTLGELSSPQQDRLRRFLTGEAKEVLSSPLKITHFDLAHNHIYVSQERGKWQVDGIIDWGEAVIGPPEWDIVYLWHWTFTTSAQDRDAMRACLTAYFATHSRPERLARRCLAALMYTPSMGLLWSDAVTRVNRSQDIIKDLTRYFYPPEIFGPPD